MAISIQMIIFLLIIFFIDLYGVINKKYNIIIELMFGLLLFIPVEALKIFTGTSYSTPGIFNISLIGYDVIIVFIIMIINNKGKIAVSKKRFLNIIICYVGIILIRFLKDGGDAISNKIFDNYLLPLIMAIIIVGYFPKNKLASIWKFIYICIFINAIMGCVEYFIGKSLFLHEYYFENVRWYKAFYRTAQYGLPFRICTLLGHPLTNGMYYMLAIIYLYNNNTIKNKTIQIIILSLAIFMTNSRMDIFMLIIYIIYQLIKNKKYIKLTLLIFISILLLQFIGITDIYNKIFIRDVNNSSIMVRVSAIKNVFNFPIVTFLFGNGYNYLNELLNSIGFKGNLEISFLIILFENGIIGFSLWLTSLIKLYNYKMEKTVDNINTKKMFNEMIIVFILIAGTSNSIGDPGTLNYMMLALLAFTNVAKISEVYIKKDEKLLI